MIDDNKKITGMMQKYLELKGHECFIANDGQTGVSLIESTKFDKVILDIAMPGFSGFDVVDQLNKDHKIGENNILVLTAVALSSDDVNRLENSGVCCIIRKPIELNDVLKILEDGCQ